MPDPLKDRFLKARLQKLQSFKENSLFSLPPIFYFLWLHPVLFDHSRLHHSQTWTRHNQAKKKKERRKAAEPRIKVSAVVKFRISWKSPAFLVLSPYRETPFSQDILVSHGHSPIRKPSGVIFNSCLSITTQRKGLQLVTERILCYGTKSPWGSVVPASPCIQGRAGTTAGPCLISE